MVNILVIKTGAIGDVLRTTCIIEGLIEKYLNPKIYWLTSFKSINVIDNNPHLRKVFVIENLDNQIYNLNFDLVLSLEEDKKCLEILTKIRKKTIFGVYENKSRKEYTPRSSYWYNMSLISKFGKETADALKKSNIFSYPEILYRMLELNWNKQKPKLYLKNNIMESSIKKIEKINLEKPIIGIVVGAGERWPLKVLPLDLQIKLINKIKKEIKNNAEILIITGPSDIEINKTKEIKKAIPSVKTHEIVDLNTFFGIINLCDILITPDTLAMHVGISLNKYVLTYFTVTSAQEIEIYHGEKIITEDEEFYCSYSTDNLKRPNCTDKININKIVNFVKRSILN